jgi:hypothetical protein
MPESSLKKIRLELARTKDFPGGNARCGYEFTAPLTEDGHLDLELYRQHKSACRVQRFWEGEKSEEGVLLHLGKDRWVFSYAPGQDDDEPAFRFDRHSFVPGEYVSVTEHDGVSRPFKVVSVA